MRLAVRENHDKTTLCDSDRCARPSIGICEPVHVPGMRDLQWLGDAEKWRESSLPPVPLNPEYSRGSRLATVAGFPYRQVYREVIGVQSIWHHPPLGDTVPMLNILTEPIIRFDQTDGTRNAASLPGIYAAMVKRRVVAFPALRPHQRHAWHAFLVQLGAMALHRSGVSDPPSDAVEWADLIRGLSTDYPEDEPWQLVVDDFTKPAFMQPPARSADREKDYQTTVATPDELDMLVTSKNHDLKAAVAVQASGDDWIFALIALQTMEGFGGAGNYGISRMNGGLGSRPAFTLAPLGGVGAHVLRDIAALLEHRYRLLAELPMSDDGVGVLWSLPWDGTPAEALPLTSLEPFYIEVCRRVRLRVKASGNVFALRSSSKAARIESKALNGRTGDPWTPVNTKENKSLTLAGGGFRYDRVIDYLTSGDWQWPLLLNATQSEQRAPMQLVARGMVRGQGKTEGYHERTIRLRPRTVQAFGRAGGTQDLGEIARTRIEKIATVQGILSHAIQVFAARGDSDNLSPEHRRLARPWLNRLNEIIDARFFEDLQDEFEDPDQVERRRQHVEWQRWLVGEARNTLHSAEDSLPCPAIHRYRARVRADGLFEGRIRGDGGLPEIFNTADTGA